MHRQQTCIIHPIHTCTCNISSSSSQVFGIVLLALRLQFEHSFRPRHKRKRIITRGPTTFVFCVHVQTDICRCVNRVETQTRPLEPRNKYNIPIISRTDTRLGYAIIQSRIARNFWWLFFTDDFTRHHWILAADFWHFNGNTWRHNSHTSRRVMIWWERVVPRDWGSPWGFGGGWDGGAAGNLRLKM